MEPAPPRAAVTATLDIGDGEFLCTLEDLAHSVRARMFTYLPAASSSSLADRVRDYPLRGGKAMRGALCLALGRALGAPAAELLPTAALLELHHNAQLILDDIADDSEERRGRPTLHRTHGSALAHNAGFELMRIANAAPMLDNERLLGRRTAALIAQILAVRSQQCLEGQDEELRWRHVPRWPLGDEEYLRIVSGKTSTFATVLPVELALLIAADGAAVPSEALRFAELAGAAFQIQDDVLNLEGGHEYGKEILGDLLEGKPTLILGHAQRCCSPAEREVLEAWMRLDRKQRPQESAADILAILQRHGSIEYARTFAQALSTCALDIFDQLFAGVPDGQDKRFVRQLAAWVVRRTR